MTRNVTNWLPELVRDTPACGVGHQASQAEIRQSATRQRPGGKGLSAGWVTGVPGLPYAAKIRALGNGVVPAQAAAALRLLAAVSAGAASAWPGHIGVGLEDDRAA